MQTVNNQFLDACTYRDIRLFDVVTRSVSNKGMLQMCNSYGQWTAVCDYGWTQYHSIVACKQLGYSNPSKCSFNTPPTALFSGRVVTILSVFGYL